MIGSCRAEKKGLKGGRWLDDSRFESGGIVVERVENNAFSPSS